MSHIPYGYEVKDGKIFIVEEATDKVRLIFQNYVSGIRKNSRTSNYPQYGKAAFTEKMLHW